MIELSVALEGTLAPSSALGECPLWDGRIGCLWWTDIENRVLWRWAASADRLTAFGTPERAASFGLTADPGELICGFESAVVLFAPESGESKALVRMPELGRGCRLNDGRVDRDGRFWVGSMVEDGSAHQASGALHRFDGAHHYTTWLRDVRIANGLCFSLSGDILYFSDSPTGVISSHSYRDGKLGPAEPLYEAPPGVHPDGANIDSEGCIWSAQWGEGRVIRIDPQGRVIGSVEVPCPQPTCVAFGGDDLCTLFVTTAAQGLTREQLNRWPHSGRTFVYRSSLAGVPEPLCTAI